MSDSKSLSRDDAEEAVYKLEDNEIEICQQDDEDVLDGSSDLTQKYRRKSQCHFCSGYYYGLNQHLRTCKGRIIFTYFLGRICYT